MAKQETAARRLGVYVATHGEVYKGATRDAKVFAELAGVNWDEEIVPRAEKRMPPDEDDDGDDDKKENGSEEK